MNRRDWETLYVFVKTVAGEFWFVPAAFAVAAALLFVQRCRATTH
ncbi:MAG: hypothetical protein OXC69_04355 [Candidatus Tectomicrobia bacterium]|nr:hypothetical protein [Candidatus Tectomicrobia bacterium]